MREAEWCGCWSGRARRAPDSPPRRAPAARSPPLKVEALPAFAAAPASSGASSAKAINSRNASGVDEVEFSSKYILGPVIGRGSTSSVHRSTCKRTGHIVATKVITEEQLRGGQFSALADQFETEISALRACRHPNIIGLEDVIVTDGRLYLVMEHLVGGELFDYVVERGTLSEREAAEILRDIASAVAYMHGKGIIHRDLKPENLLLVRKPGRRETPAVKIIDFGLSKILSEPAAGVASSFLGTRGYLAPEMLKRQKYSKSVDMWALGVIAYILVCGCLPFDDDSSRCTSPMITRKFGLRYPSWANKLSPQCKDFLKQLLEIDPAARTTAPQAVMHPWLNDAESVPNNILASPAHMRHLPKTPKQARAPPTRAAQYAATHGPPANGIRRKNSF
ncbi:kinase-like domain-containing protein [Pelagophyceae sp. CCMP2097]|nr:kinase-like domain-containing protein [Pelagophyceae sp. CCMP2097]